MIPYIGQRVRFNVVSDRNYTAKYGWIGTITQYDDGSLYVKWDNYPTRALFYLPKELQYLKELGAR